MGTLFHDVRFGIRMVLTKPAFSAAAIAVLALGIGANTAVFSLVNSFLLKPLMIEKPEQIVGCYSRDRGQAGSYRAFSYPNYADVRENNPVFASLAAHTFTIVGLAEGDATRRTFTNIVSANYFATLGVPLYRGRAFTAAEERPGSGVPVVIASHSFWKKSGADPDVLGKTLKLNGRIFTIVGILPEGFTGTTAMISPELYMPMGMYEAMKLDEGGGGRSLAARNNHTLLVIGRLRDGLTTQSADAQLAAVAAGLEQAYPAENKDQTFVVSPLSRLSVSTSPQNDGQLMIPTMMLLGVSGVVLLIASLNVANMMLARGTARRREMAIRLAIGGGRRNILQQLFTEGLILALLGGAAGLAVAYWSTTVLVRSMARLAPFDFVYSAAPDARILAATIAFGVLSTLVFGMGPAWNLWKTNVWSGLKDGAPSDAGGGAPRRLFSRNNMLVMGQISLSLALLTIAGLFVRSAVQAASIEPGFRMEQGLLLEVDASLAGHDEVRGRQIYKTLVERLAQTPGVQSASLAATVPFGMVSLGRGVQRSTDPESKDGANTVECRLNMVGADYFSTLGIPLLRGRTFQAAESEPSKKLPVAIIDKLAAERLWPNQDPVGQHVRMVSGDGGRKPVDAEVVGVVGGIQESLLGKAFQPHIYVPFGQEYQADVNIHLRVAAAGPEAQAQLLEAVRREVRAVDARLPVLALRTMRDHLDSSFALWLARTAARMFTLFGAVALLLAVIGLYGVRAYAVARRMREIGIRMALGATSRETSRMVLREGLLLTCVGVAVGLLLSLAAGKILSSFLYRVSAADPLVLLGAPAVLTAVSLLACYLPARKASRVDPLVALRYE